MPATRRVLVTGAGGPAGIAVIRDLTKLGHTTIAVDADPWATGLALADAGVLVPRADDSNYGPALLAAAALHDVDVLVATVVEEYPALQALSPDLTAAGIAHWLPTIEAIAVTNDKLQFAERLSDRGIAHPATTTIVDGLGPWVVKPRSGRGSRDVTLTGDLQTAQAAVKFLDGHGIVQAMATGREWTADVLTNHHGDVLCVVPRWRVEVKAGISTKGETFADPTVIELVTKTVQACELAGVCNVQGFLTDEGPIIVELNPRFSGGLPLSLAAGADLVGGYVELVADPAATINPERLTWVSGARMQRYFEAVFTLPDRGPTTSP